MNEEKLITTAKSYVGYLEKRNAAQLDNPTANAGSANYTRFGRDYTKYTGSNLQGSPWCACFVSCCFVETFGLAEARRMLGGSLFCSCTAERTALRGKGRYDKTPRVGDLIFFRASSGSNKLAHVGLVYKEDASRVYTIEGNTSSTAGVVANGGAVALKSYARTYSRIDGYGHPLYSATVQSDKEDTFMISIPVLKKGMKSNTVKSLQQWLSANGCKGKDGHALDPDGDFGANTDYAVRVYQGKNNLTVDGIAGEKTWRKLLGVAV